MFKILRFRFGKYSYARRDDIPDKAKKNCIYIVGSPIPWVLIFTCPCGCQDIIQLNLLEEDTPCWRFTIYRSRISIYPSVWRKKGCKTHFWIVNGKAKEPKSYWTRFTMVSVICATINSLFTGKTHYLSFTKNNNLGISQDE